MTLRVKGDTYVDDHHTVEDTGIVMGQALREALGDKSGIRRFGSVMVPLDEALVMAAVDVPGRGELFWDVALAPRRLAPSTPSSATSSSPDSRAMRALPFTCGLFAARMHTTSSRQPLRRRRAPCARPWSRLPRSDGSVPSTKGSL